MAELDQLRKIEKALDTNNEICMRILCLLHTATGIRDTMAEAAARSGLFAPYAPPTPSTKRKCQICGNLDDTVSCPPTRPNDMGICAKCAKSYRKCSKCGAIEPRGYPPAVALDHDDLCFDCAEEFRDHTSDDLPNVMRCKICGLTENLTNTGEHLWAAPDLCADCAEDDSPANNPPAVLTNSDTSQQEQRFRDHQPIANTTASATLPAEREEPAAPNKRRGHNQRGTNSPARPNRESGVSLPCAGEDKNATDSTASHADSTQQDTAPAHDAARSEKA